jgi:putative NADPH-quinone reductase
MRVLVVFCHPTRESFQGSILAAVVERLERDGHAVSVTDLYAEGFDPVLDAEAWRAHREGRAHGAVELAGHVAALRQAEGLVLVFPTWWYGLPAMLKGWFDRVWQPGVAFALEAGVFRLRYLTRLRRFAAVTTCGSPRAFIAWIVGDPARRQVMRGLALQGAHGVRTRWAAIYQADGKSPAALAAARQRAVRRVAAIFAGR